MIAARWLGTVAYGEALDRQRAHRDALARGDAHEALWGLEHPPVITTGRRTVEDLDPERVGSAGYALFTTERGGFATCHEPGQLVVYMLLDVRTLGVRRLVAAIEDAVIGWLRGHGAPAVRRDGTPGVWVGERKLCALGLHAGGGFTMHGLALNLVNDLRGFGLITPCGLSGVGVSSLLREVGSAPSPSAAFTSLAPLLREHLLDARGGAR